MVESSGGVGTASGSRSKPASSFESAGDRLRFTVELRPDETTIVSWKKLLKEATSNKTHVPGPMVPGPSIEAHDQPVPLVPPPPAPTASASLRQPTENDANESEAQAGPNRLSNVIERIERMYAGNGSSDEEDVVLDDVPDDDEYDTEDSFIDDTELDDYFQVDNSEIKHDGFFVNRGLLERIEPTITTIQQPKKRRRKDMAKGVASDDGDNPTKLVKTGNKGRKASSVDKNLTTQSQKVVVPNLNREEITAVVSVKKKSVNFKVTGSLLGPSNGNVIRQDRDTDQHKTGVMSSKSQLIKKESTQIVDPSSQKSKDRSPYLSKSHSGKALNNAYELDRSIQRKEKAGLVERFDLNAPPSREPLPTKSPLVQRKEGSAVRPKTTTLEKAIRELEKIVAESRPPSVEVQDPDNSSQGVKRRLPAEIKQKLAKVARFAQASYGKIPKDLIIRLMSIVGHLMQLRTLKRNLKIMASTGLSAKQEKDDRVQKIKLEVAEMVNLRVPLLKSKLGQQTANSDDFQEAGPEEKLRYSMDDALENKICDLYDLYVERLEEHSGPPIRRLYEELAAMWPSGVMDTDGIKRAISRAKDQKKALGNPRKDQENIKKRKSVVSNEENTSLAEATNTTTSHIHEKSILDSRDHGSISFGDARFPIAFGINSLNTDKPKQEKGKGSSSSNPIDAIPINAMLPKKKVKRKPNAGASEAQFRVDKVVPQAEERYKQQKHATVSVTKTALQPRSENLS